MRKPNLLFILLLFLIIIAPYAVANKIEITDWIYSDGCYSPQKDKVAFCRYREKYTSTKSPIIPLPYHKVLSKKYEFCIFDIKANNFKKIAEIGGLPRHISWKGDLITYSLPATFGSIYIINQDGSNRKKILDYGECPELSPDVKNIAYILNGNEARIISIDGSQNQSLYKIDKLAYLKWKDVNTLFFYVRDSSVGWFEFILSSATIAKTIKPDQFEIIRARNIESMVSVAHELTE